MEEAPKGTIQEELDWGVRQLQSGLLQLNLSQQQVEEIRETLQSQNVPVVQKRQTMRLVFGDYRKQMVKEQETLLEAALEPMPVAIQRNDAKDCGSGAYRECSESSFQFNFIVPEGVSDEPHPAGGSLTSDPSDSSREQQAGSAAVTDGDSCRGSEEEKLEIFTGAESQGTDFKFNFAISGAGAGLQRGNCTGLSVAVDQSAEEQAAPVLESHCMSAHVRKPENTASKPSQKKKKNKVRSSKPTAEPVRDGKRQSGDSDGRERHSPAQGEGHCLSSEEQLRREVDWCIEQLELGLRNQKTSQRQADGALHALRTLRSEKAPLVKKRQVMRSIFGDYRKKMEEEWRKEFKLMLAATKSADIKPVGEQTKSKIFRKSVNQSKKGGDFPRSGSVSPKMSRVECVSECDRDQSHFRFNFF